MKLCYFVNDASYFSLHWLDRAQAARQAGYEVHLLAGFSDGFVMKQLAQAGITCHPLKLRGASRNPFNFLLGGLQVLRLLSELNPWLVHCVTLKPCLIGILLSRYYRVILSFPGLGRLFSSSGCLARLLRWSVCRGWRRAARKSRCLFTFEHEDDQAFLCRNAGIPLYRTRVTGVSGVNPLTFSYVPHPQNATPVILFAARLIQAKGLDTLVRVCRRLRQEGVALTLQVVGLPVVGDRDAIPSAQIQAWSDAGDILWSGTCHDMPTLLAQVDVVALPTRYAEGVPRILLEAASCGRPSVAFDKGGCRTILHDSLCGLLAPEGDEDAFYLALRDLLTDPSRQVRMGKNGRERVIDCFTAAQASRMMLRCYDALSDDVVPVSGHVLESKS